VELIGIGQLVKKSTRSSLVTNWLFNFSSRVTVRFRFSVWWLWMRIYNRSTCQ